MYYYLCGLASNIKDSASLQYQEDIDMWMLQVRNRIYANSTYTYGTIGVIEEFFMVALDVCEER